MFKKILVLLILIFSFFIKTETFAVWNFWIPVEEAFSDIDKEYKYYYELETLYYKWIIEPEIDWKFHPDKLLNRDEFVAIAEETSCKKCIIPNVDIDFLNNYKEKPFFDVWLENKYFYCIADAKNDNYVLGYKPWDSCKDWTKKIWSIPFCLNNNITREEALAVVMRMGGILTDKQAEVIISWIKNWQNYPDLSLDMKASNIDWSVNSFYPYFKKALEYEVLDYDFNWNKRIYKLVEKKWNYLRPGNLITKEDFLKMAFVALKWNSCVEKIKDTLDLQIQVYDKSCNESKESKWLCKKSDLVDDENIFDFWEKSEWVCELWVDNKKWYIWRFYNLDTWSQIIKYWKYIDNYNFLIEWKYRVYLRVTDKCGATWEVYITINISSDFNNNLSVSIDANPIRWYAPLFVTLKWIINGWIPPFQYIWNLADWNFSNTKNTAYNFLQKWLYNVELTVIDKEKNEANATVSINVLNEQCTIDTDWDWINNCLDKCPLVDWDKKNDWCPIFLPPISNPDSLVWECLKKENKKSYIFW